MKSSRLAAVLFWSGFALALPQALHVRRRALRLGPAEGPTEGRIGTGPRRRLVGIGDSIIAGVGVERTDEMLTAQVAAAWARRAHVAVDWQAIGRNGIDAAGTTARLLPRLSPEAVDAFLVSVGVNDVTALKNVRVWQRDLAALLDALGRHSPEATIALLAIPPLDRFPALPWPLSAVLGLRAGTFNQAADAVLQGRSGASVPIQHVDIRSFGPLLPSGFAVDGYHPNADACAQLASVAATALP